MADNVTITQGTGVTTTVAADDISGVMYQRIKIVDGADDGVTGIPGDATNGLDVDVTRVQGAVTVANSTAASLNATVLLNDANGAHLEFRTENENWNAGDHGILVFGRDIVGSPNKYRAIATNAEGDIYVDISDINGVEPAVGTGASNTGTLRVVIATDQQALPVTATATDLDIRNLTSTDVITVTGGAGQAADVKVTLDSETVQLAAGSANIGDVDVLSIAAGDNNIGNVDIASIAAGDNNIGNVDVVTVPSDPFGVNADAASATGSISAKLRYLLNSIADAAGSWVRPFPGRSSLKYGTATATTTLSTSIIAGTASNYLYITSVSVWNSSATNTRITLQDGSGGTSLYVIAAPTVGGAIVSFPSPLLVPTSGNGLFFAAGDNATTLYVSATGYISTA